MTATKIDALREEGTLNPRPEAVEDPLFQDSEFYDPSDLVQIKYELLRRVRAEGRPVGETAAAFGFSRPTYYQAKAAFERDGIAGLVPKKRGPRGPHKLTGEVLAFVRAEAPATGPLRAPELARRVRERFGLVVHPRTIERALAGKKKPR